MTRTIALTLFVCLFLTGAVQPAFAARIKDIVAFEGVRDNILIGYGLVVGLDGSGDRLRNNRFTEESLVSFLERQGVPWGRGSGDICLA